MRRGLVLFLLVVTAFWQVIAVAGQATAFGNAEENTHALLHWQEESHHHLDDGAVVQDDSDESMEHVVADGCLGAAAVWATASFNLSPAESTRPEMGEEAALPSPSPDGLRRPPRLTA